ncbi:MAG: phosphatidylinositol phosphate synthase [Jatrophihabitans sp.]|uniref:phosphatidylinositol phosphate synthase n=1 Tax=Jatrophihabitans sp. TaxID=1932789 RepID=UPI003F818F89
MLNILGRDAISRALTPVGTSLARKGVSPNAITVTGTIGVVLFAAIFYPKGPHWFFLGSLLITLCVLMDMLDGAVARASGRPTKFGGVLDSSCDRVADAAIFGALAWYYGLRHDRWMLLAALLCLVLGALTSYIRARAEGAGLTATVGIAERAERLIVVLVGAGFTGLFGPKAILAVALWLLVAASTITVWQRFATVYQQSRALDRAPVG